jgi:uncharacterized protein YfaP (DUF2135 family)
MRVLAAITALAFVVAPGSEPHVVTLRLDSVAPNQPIKVDIKAPIAGLHRDGGGAGAIQVSITTPASVIVDQNVDGVMIDAENSLNVRVSFEQGGSPREIALKIAGSHMILRRNMDGDLVPGARILPTPNRP